MAASASMCQCELSDQERRHLDTLVVRKMLPCFDYLVVQTLSCKLLADFTVSKPF